MTLKERTSLGRFGFLLLAWRSCQSTTFMFSLNSVSPLYSLGISSAFISFTVLSPALPVVILRPTSV